MTRQRGGSVQRAVIALLCGSLVAVSVACSSDAAAEVTSSPTPGPSERFQTTASLALYRWSIQMEIHAELIGTEEAPLGLQLDDAKLEIRVDGERVNPDREHSRSVTTFGFISFEREEIVVGDRLWTRSQDGAWRERATLVTPEDLVGQDLSISPHVLMGQDDPAFLERLTRDLEARPHTFETVNDRETRRWFIDDSYVQTLLPNVEEILPDVLRPEDLTLEVWTDIETAVAVRVVVRAATPANPDAAWIQIDLWDLNDPTISVDVPEGAIGP